MKNIIEEWSKKFDYDFPACDCIGNNLPPHFKDSKVNRNWIINHIKDRDQALIESIMGEVKGREVMGIGGAFGEGFEAGFKKAQDDILSLLQDYKDNKK